MIEIPLGVKVQCNGNRVGKVSHVILNPSTYQVTHFVVEEKSAPHNKRLIPLRLVQETACDHIILHLTKEELSKQDNFIGSFSSKVPVSTPVPLTNELFKFDKQIWVDIKCVPPGRRAVQYNAKAKATDGFVGRVVEFLVDPSNDIITHIVLRAGHLWGAKQVLIPIWRIRFFTEKTIYLKLCKAEIHSLPEYIALHDK
jgi:uncharacterized protein YrrD